MKGYGSPRSERGQATAYGAPPWRMNGRVFTIWYRLQDPDEARKHMSPALQIPDDPLCRARFYDITHDAGMGDALVAQNPEQTHFHEAVIAIEARYGDYHGDTSVYMYADDPTYIAWGREVYGWTLKAGKITMTRPWNPQALQSGVQITGTLERFSTRLMTAQIELTEPIPITEYRSMLPANWFSVKLIPNVEGNAPDVHQLILAGPNRTDISEVWAATGSLEIGEGFNDELYFLRPREIVGADYVAQADLSVGYGKILAQL